ncbi:MAG: dipeptide epimerase [Planctomycetes bacterium]|nr:dipeptide epimerase [Planctomycetota bacterium]
MTQPAMIRRLSAERLVLPLDEPFVIASGAKPQIENVVVRVELEGGTFGVGEASPLEPINGESASTVLAVVDDLAAAFGGRDARELESLSQMMRQTFGVQAAARSGIEMALLDAVTRQDGTNPWRLYGGRELGIETDYTISIVSAKTAAEQATRLVAGGFTKLKIKLSGRLEDDLDRVRAVAQAAPGAEIQLDANEGYPSTTALQLLEGLDRARVTPVLLEQPTPRHDLAAMRRVRDGCTVMIAADESVFTLDDARRVIEFEAADVINIKLAKSGPVEGRRIHALCQDAGCGLMIGCMLESRIGMAASVQFAAGLGGFSFIDLDPHSAIEEPWTGGPSLTGPSWTIDPDEFGWGVTKSGS